MAAEETYWRPEDGLLFCTISTGQSCDRSVQWTEQTNWQNTLTVCVSAWVFFSPASLTKWENWGDDKQQRRRITLKFRLPMYLGGKKRDFFYWCETRVARFSHWTADGTDCAKFVSKVENAEQWGGCWVSGCRKDRVWHSSGLRVSLRHVLSVFLGNILINTRSHEKWESLISVKISHFCRRLTDSCWPRLNSHSIPLIQLA